MKAALKTLAGTAAVACHAEPVAQTPGGCPTISNHIADQPLRHEPRKSSTACLTLITTTTEARIDSRLLAKQLDNKHRHVLALIDRYIDKFKFFGDVRFKNAHGDRKQGGGMAERYALLNEEQAYFLLSLSRNSDIVVSLKAKLIRAFGEYSRAAHMRKTEYLPAYHEANYQIKVLANGDPGEHFFHMNLNKLMNKVAGIEPGHRASASEGKQALLTVGLMMASDAMQGAPDGKTGYQRAKEAVQPLQILAIRRAS